MKSTKSSQRKVATKPTRGKSATKSTKEKATKPARGKSTAVSTKEKRITKPTQEKKKRSAEDWVNVARVFGEKCIVIQQDSKLNIEQKLEKQKVLANKMAKEIENDPHLSSRDKKVMIDSIQSYIKDWSEMHDVLQKKSASAKRK